jgi:MFS family permease
MSEETFTPQDSLSLIQSMINKTKKSMSDDSIYYLVWGWLTFVACTGQFVLKHIYNYEKHYRVWWLMVVGVIFSFWYGRKEDREQKVKTYVDESIKWLWIGMGIAYFVLSMILSKYGWDKIVFPFFILLYGLGTFVSGNIIQFRPLVIGGIMAFILAITSTFADYDYQMLFAAGAILISYIIPAYLLRRKNKVANQ